MIVVLDSDLYSQVFSTILTLPFFREEERNSDMKKHTEYIEYEYKQHSMSEHIDAEAELVRHSSSVLLSLAFLTASLASYIPLSLTLNIRGLVDAHSFNWLEGI